MPRKFTPRPDGCIGCPLNETSVPGFCPDKIPPKAKYVFLAEAPGKNEIGLSEPMVGKAGFVLKNWLIRAVDSMRLAWDKKEIGLANVLRCLPPEVQGSPYPRGKDKEAAEAQCRQYDSWPETVHTFVLFGAHSQRLLFGKELSAEDASDKELRPNAKPKGVMGRIGREYMRDGIRYVFAPHPALILRKPSLVLHGQMALQVASNTEKVVDPLYTEWKEALKELKEIA